MLKLIGAAIIISGCGFFGFYKAQCLKKRAEEIGKIISGLVLLENEINYGKGDIKTVLASVGRMNGIEMFKYAAENTIEFGIKDSFKRAVEECEAQFLGTEKEALILLAENLGMTDTEAQIKSIRHTKALLESAEETAKGEYARSGRLYRCAGVLTGFAVVILLL